MFQKLIVDNSDRTLGAEEKRLISCARLVADISFPSTFYVFGEWSKRNVVGLPTSDFMPETPRLAYITQNDWMSRKEGEIPAKILKNEFVLSFTPFIQKAALEQQGLNSTTAILCLAAVGVDLVLPNVSLNLIAEEEIDKIRTKLEEDRIEYVNKVTEIADESLSRLKSGALADILEWANNEVNFKIIPKARIFERNVKLLDKKTLENAGVSFWKEGIPAIGKSYIDKGSIEAGKTFATELLKIIVSGLSKDHEERNLPEIGYTMKLAKFVG